MQYLAKNAWPNNPAEAFKALIRVYEGGQNLKRTQNLAVFRTRRGLLEQKQLTPSMLMCQPGRFAALMLLGQLATPDGEEILHDLLDAMPTFVGYLESCSESCWGHCRDARPFL